MPERKEALRDLFLRDPSIVFPHHAIFDAMPRPISLRSNPGECWSGVARPHRNPAVHLAGSGAAAHVAQDNKE